MIQNHLYLDVLALVRRGGESLLNEPHAGGGSPVLASSGTAYFSDVHGTTLGRRERGRKYAAARQTAFGEGDAAYFTGKPAVAGLGRAFLLRNYRPDLAKWATADPLGYPDGWNSLAYCWNVPTFFVDYCGGKAVISSFMDALNHYAYGDGEDATIHSSVILQSVSSQGYKDAIQYILNQLAHVPYNATTGILRLSSSYQWEQGDILGRTTVKWKMSLRWNASPWYLKEDGTYYRNVYGDGYLDMEVSDTWDFDVHNGDSVLRSIFGEIIPFEIASLYSIIVSSGIGESYKLSGSALNVEHFSVEQLKE